MGELVARYALSHSQLVRIDSFNALDGLLSALSEHEALGHRIQYSTDEQRGVLIYSVYEGDPDPSPREPRAYIAPGDVGLFVQLQASLLAMGVTSTSDDIKAIREAGVTPFIPKPSERR